MLKRLLFGLGLVLSCPAALLAQRNCGTMGHLDKLEQQYPGTKNRLFQTDRLLEQRRNQASAHKTNFGVVTIPVVVHVIYRNAAQNISLAQIQSQIDVLNEDFSKTNADGANTPAAFKPLAGDMQIRFELAKRDPNGDPTTGITRTQTTASGFGIDDAMKFAGRGGHDAWDRDKYLNLWVCNLTGGLLGYAQFPGSGPNRTDGVVIGYNYFGRTGTLAPDFNKGRTATHEVGHWLGLYHIWGDEPACAYDDQVADTPLQKGENYGCPSFPKISGSGAACAAGSPGAMFMNYMDYVDDACMNMFSVGQVTRARDILQLQRPTILTSDGAVAVNVKPLDAAIFKIESPKDLSCDQEILPKVVLKNRGSSALTSLTLSYKIDNGPLQTLLWSGNLASFATETISFPKTNVGYGNHTLTAFTSSPNGQADDDPSNDMLALNLKVEEQTDGLGLPFTESFETPVFPPQGWSLSNPDDGYTWERTRRAASKGFYSAYINNYDYEYIGEADELQLPALNLSKVSEPKLTFRVAYTATYFGQTADTLEILASKDCGVTYSSVYKKASRILASIPTTVGSPFYPDTSQWRTDSIGLESFAGRKSVILKFRSITGYENNLYIDDVQVNGKAIPTQPDPKPALSALKIFPNPTTGRFILQTENRSNAEARVIILNSIGQEVFHQLLTPQAGEIKLNLVGKANGIYFVHVLSEGKTYKQKLVLAQDGGF